MGDTLFEWPSMGVYCNKSEYVFILKLGALWLYANRLSLAKFTLFALAMIHQANATVSQRLKLVTT